MDPHPRQSACHGAPGGDPSLEKLGRVSIGDIGVPRSRLAEVAVGLHGISTRTGVRIFTVAHASDGNLHPMIVMDEEDSVTEGQSKGRPRLDVPPREKPWRKPLPVNTVSDFSSGTGSFPSWARSQWMYTASSRWG